MKLIKDRTFQAGLLAALLIVAMGALRPDKPEGMGAIRYWASKVHWQHCADMVLTGDSRVIMGLSPAAMSASLPGQWRIYNYAFGANGYGEEYLDAIEEVLDPASGQRAVVLGISPLSLTPVALVKNNFFEQRDKSPCDFFFALHFGELLEWVEPMSFRDAWHGLFPAMKEDHAYTEYFADGWVPSERQKVKPRRWLATYTHNFTQSPVSDEIIDHLLKRVRQWNGQGIEVYAFRPPSHECMVELENAISGFEEERFVAKFQAAGGHWIEMNQTRYHSFDGSHLSRHAAQEMSRDLALGIRAVRQSLGVTDVTAGQVRQGGSSHEN